MSPLDSLQDGHWFKLICGASFQHLPSVRTLTIAYALAGADCIDVAADPAVIGIAREALAIAQSQAKQLRSKPSSHSSASFSAPWLMVSINDGDDPHFRKAYFDPKECPAHCPQPCIKICPTDAITPTSLLDTGVIEARCYGCGRCPTICPHDRIRTQSHNVDVAHLIPLFLDHQIDAIEIHTQVSHEQQFQDLWLRIQPLLPHLKLLAISCPYEPGVIEYLKGLQHWMPTLPYPLLWQTDGRPMSGDIGEGATRTTIKYAQLALRANLQGYIQVAGGTNHHTVSKLKTLGLLKGSQRIQPIVSQDPSDPVSHRAWMLRHNQDHPHISGIAYGSYGRSLFDTLQSQLDQLAYGSHKLEEVSVLLDEAVRLAASLVYPLKGRGESSEASSIEHLLRPSF